ncbi:MAG: sensor histidine kinase [Rhizobiaceae bacterium]|nr:sensor histidine kinase [Rhizobiaceae bacterium]
MAFKIRARTLLELGAELIGSDAVAIYELVKNAVDAGSPVVRIKVQSVLPYSYYRQALEQVDSGAPISDVRQRIERWIQSDAPRQGSKDLLDRLNAADDADEFRSALVTAYREVNFIEIDDDGEGMTLDDLGDIYLTIGTRSRRAAKAGWDTSGEPPARTFLGDKGVGRLSVMRLGDHLEVITSKAGEERWNVLEIDWTRFSHDSDELLSEVEIEPSSGARKPKPNHSGTLIKISHLKADWSRARFNELLKGDFSRMVDPFERRRGNRLFRIEFNGQVLTLPQIPQRLFEQAHAIVTAKFEYDDRGAARIVGEIDYRLNTKKKKTIQINETQIVSFTASKSTRVVRGLGPFKLEFLWFNRIYLTAVEGLGTKRDVQDLVKQWAGGLMVFRDGFRINPYGGPDDDWLELDKRAFASRGYKLNRQQIVGRVILSWRNRHLVEQTNREGLFDNEYKEVFVAILRRILADFKTFSQEVDDSLKREDLTSLDVLKQRVADAKTDIQRRIRQIALDAPAQAGPLREVERIVQHLVKQIDGVDEIVDDYKDERRKFVHLAGLGLMVELILHELGRSSSSTLSTLEAVDVSQLPGKFPAVFNTLESQLRTLQKRIESLDPLSTARRQTKERFTVQDVVDEIVDARAEQSKRHSVTVTVTSSKGPWTIKAVRGMLIQIIENLLTNSYYWLKQRAIVEANFRPQILIDIDEAGETISITDNGPGIPASDAEYVFRPFVSAKPAGEGSGLGLYIARELADYHDWSLSLVGKSSEESWNTFVVDLGAKRR